MPERSLAERRISPSQPPSPTMKVSERLAALHIASLWCIAVAQPLFDVLRGSPEFFVAHDATPADLVGLVLLFCLAGPAIAALALWIVGRLAPGWRAGATGIAQILEHVRRAAEKVVEKVKGLVRCTQPDRDDTSAEPPKDERPKPTPQPQRGGDRSADDDWMPGRSLLD